MSKNKKTNLPFLSSFNIGLGSLKEKLKKKNDDCPISTLTQLMQPPQVRHTNSLRSLRTKACQPQKVVVNAPDSTTLIDRGLSDSFSKADSSNVGGSSNTLQDVTNQINTNLSNDGVFAVPTMRAPRALRICTEDPQEELLKAATLAWCTLDKELTEKIFYILTVHLLLECEKQSPNYIESEYQENNALSKLDDFFHKLVSGDNYVLRSNNCADDLQDAENMSSVSGYQCYRGPIGNQNRRTQDFGGYFVGGRMPGFERDYEPSVASSVYDDNQFGHRMSRVSSMQVRSTKLLPSFIDCIPGNSFIGSMWQPRNETFNNQFQNIERPFDMQGNRLIPRMSNFNSASSVAGSNYPENFRQQREDPHINQTSMFGGNPRMWGYYPSRPMSVRPDASFAYGSQRDMQPNYSTVMNPGNSHRVNQFGQVDQNLRRNDNTRNVQGNFGVMRPPRQDRYEDENQSMYVRENQSTFVRKNQSMYVREKQSNSETPRRKILSPLEPIVYVERLDMTQQDVMRGGPTKTKNHNVHTAGNTSCYNLRLNTSRQNMTTNATGDSFRHPSKQIKQVEKVVITTPYTEISRKETIKVTRSGRAVRAPQNFWASDMSCISTHHPMSQVRGRKRKRVY